jgi:predicted NodU family carbamoyl transferase
MLLNTSLNIKGEPLVDTWADATHFQNKYKIKIY